MLAPSRAVLASTKGCVEVKLPGQYFNSNDRSGSPAVTCINLTPLPGLFRGTGVLVFWLSRSIRNSGAIRIEDYRKDDNAAGDHLPHEIANTDQD
jgi:hypothetical protein